MLVLTSSSFHDQGPIEQRYGKRGDNLSPQLGWRGAPDGTRSYALSMVDLHPVARGHVHWLVVDLGADVSALPEGAADGALPAGARELTPYMGPFPPSGTHDYAITLYALRTPTVPLGPGAGLAAFSRAVAGETLATARLVGRFTRIH